MYTKYYVALSDDQNTNVVDGAYFDSLEEAVDLFVKMQADYPEIKWAVYEADVNVIAKLPIVATKRSM